MKKRSLTTFFKLCTLLSTIVFRPCFSHDNSMHFVTAADSDYFPCLYNFIGSIHKVNFDELAEISIFDLGLTEQQREILNSMRKVHVYPIEITNKDMLIPLKRHPQEEKWARGLYSWKPVVIKAALDMFDCILYADSSAIFTKPMDSLFAYIRKNSYFLISCNHSIAWMTGKFIAEKFELHTKDREWILGPSTSGLSAGFQGLTRSVYNSYILPMYELSKDIKNFIDDGTTPHGYTGRHDQTLFSICASLNNFSILPWVGSYELDGQKVPFNIAPGCNPGAVSKADIIIHGDHQSHYNFKSYIRYKK